MIPISTNNRMIVEITTPVTVARTYLKKDLIMLKLLFQSNCFIFDVVFEAKLHILWCMFTFCWEQIWVTGSNNCLRPSVVLKRRLDPLPGNLPYMKRTVGERRRSSRIISIR